MYQFFPVTASPLSTEFFPYAWAKNETPGHILKGPRGRDKARPAWTLARSRPKIFGILEVNLGQNWNFLKINLEKNWDIFV
jgi:hypothetical protein